MAEANEDKDSKDRTGLPDRQFLTEAASAEALLIPSSLTSKDYCQFTEVETQAPREKEENKLIF